jgi:phosphoribosylformylglycinamidine synthase I
MSTSHDCPSALVITAAGINCDVELAHAFELAGARAVELHLNRLIADPEVIERFDLIGLPGGFSFGDAVAAGRIAAAIMRHTLWSALVHAVRRGVPIIAPCNGFQIAVQLGLLPGPIGDQGAESEHEERPPRPIVALANNASARFADRWCRIEIPSNTRCIWTRGLEPSPAASLLPIAHGEGRFIVEDRDLMQRLDRAGQIAVRYAPDDNPNGSMGDIAGICDATGLVVGVMPHPERFMTWTQHPSWTRLEPGAMRGEEPLGLRMFRNAVEFAVRSRDANAEAHRQPQVHHATAHST